MTFVELILLAFNEIFLVPTKYTVYEKNGKVQK